MNRPSHYIARAEDSLSHLLKWLRRRAKAAYLQLLIRSVEFDLEMVKHDYANLPHRMRITSEELDRLHTELESLEP